MKSVLPNLLFFLLEFFLTTLFQIILTRNLALLIYKFIMIIYMHFTEFIISI